HSFVHRTYSHESHFSRLRCLQPQNRYASYARRSCKIREGSAICRRFYAVSFVQRNHICEIRTQDRRFDSAGMCSENHREFQDWRTPVACGVRNAVSKISLELFFQLLST
ncbi:hypothetical protein PENTCL1PPCAC_13287, partial [Pristionchus entomophagus]